jgi:ribonuclease R
MERKLGEEYPGVITGVTNFGVFVQIPELQIDGLVHVTSLDNDYYEFDQASQALVGDRSGKRYRLGDPLDIVVARVDLETKRIDFRLAGEGPRDRDKGRSGRRRRGGPRR